MWRKKTRPTAWSAFSTVLGISTKEGLLEPAARHYNRCDREYGLSTETINFTKYALVVAYNAVPDERAPFLEAKANKFGFSLENFTVGYARELSSSRSV